MLGLCHWLTFLTCCAATTVHTPPKCMEESVKKKTPSILLCDNHQGCFIACRKQWCFQLYAIKGLARQGVHVTMAACPAE